MSKKFRIIENDPKIKLSYTVPITSRHGDVSSAVQFTGYVDGMFLLGTKGDWNDWSLDQVSFHQEVYQYLIEDHRRMVEYIVAADLMDRVKVEKGNTLHVATEYPLDCKWQSQMDRGSRKVVVQAYQDQVYILQFPVFLKSAFQTIAQIRQVISEVKAVVPRLTPEALRCLRFIAFNRTSFSWNGFQNIRSLKKFLLLFDMFQEEFELLMTISPEQVIQMRDFINEWFDFFKLIRKGSSRTIGCITIGNETRSLGVSIAGLSATSIAMELKDPLPSDSVYINEVFRYLLIVIACIKFAEKDSAFISRVTREVFERK